MGKPLDPSSYNKKEPQKTHIFLQNTSFTVTIRHKVFKYQFESNACVSIQVLPRKALDVCCKFKKRWKKFAYDLKLNSLLFAFYFRTQKAMWNPSPLEFR